MSVLADGVLADGVLVAGVVVVAFPLLKKKTPDC
ncbi:DUF3927 family protein [Escherichia coli]|nr:DUF3927 family protein [Escherichia coli]